MDLLKDFESCRKLTEAICEPLQTEDYVPQPVAYASPPKWHLAHTTWFFEEMILKKYLDNYQEFHTDYSFLFNSYYNTVGERTFRAHRGNMTRPLVQEVYAYRAYVNEQVGKLLKEAISDELRDLLVLGINHEQQHQELLWTDLKFMLGHNPLFPRYKEGASLVGDRNDEQGFIRIEEGIYEVGSEGKTFHFDNEKGRHKTYIQTCEISKALVTNGEYLEFIEAGGYETFRWWLDEAWSWINEENVRSPLYWHKIEGKWYYYTLEGLVPVDPDAILTHVSYYEAMAYATWRSMRLPTEFEWEVASEQLDWGKRWEWTNSAYLPYPGFQVAEGAVGEYNGKFMVNQQVLRGASGATSPGHSRKTYRNFFHPHLQWQFTGIRLAK
ncbi:MAG: ergothioneine biosynthesis protein EgtB [Bacteroidetes bacterium]|nr:MAG: ergothioneine biosynthesis protein EgtB [Bacteroidota bacterium]